MRLLGVGCLVVGLLAGCEGAGEGQLDGTLFLRGCPILDPQRPAEQSVPSPLPAFQLNPTHFFVEVVYGVRSGFTPDNRSATRLLLRMQRGAAKLDRSDGFELLVHDLDKLPELVAQAASRGEPGVPVVPPALDNDAAPLPPAPDNSVRAGLLLFQACRYPQAQPSLRGFVRFTEIGQTVGQTVAGEVSVTVEDLRSQREQPGPGPVIPNTAGRLQGFFRVPIRSGQASPSQ